MTTKKERLRRKRKFVRNVKRMVRNLLLMPGKIPPIDLRAVEAGMRCCEVFGVLFVITLIARLSTGGAAGDTGTPTTIAVLNTLNGIVFIALLLFIKLADYQDRLVRMEMADYIYIR